MRNNAGYIVSFVFQALCFAAALFGVVIAFIDGDDGFFIMGLLSEFFLGIVQIVAAIVGSCFLRLYPQKFKNMYIAYWALVGVYALSGVAMYAVGIDDEEFWIPWLLSAWLIAIYFFVLTIMQAFGKKSPPPIPHIDMPGFYENVNR